MDLREFGLNTHIYTHDLAELHIQLMGKNSALRARSATSFGKGYRISATLLTEQIVETSSLVFHSIHFCLNCCTTLCKWAKFTCRCMGINAASVCGSENGFYKCIFPKYCFYLYER